MKLHIPKRVELPPPPPPQYKFTEVELEEIARIMAEQMVTGVVLVDGR